MRGEYLGYFNDVASRLFTRADSLQFWKKAQKAYKYPRLCLISKLLRTVPASAIPQRMQISELKRRCGGLSTRTKVETLDRDAAVFTWNDDEVLSI